MRVRSPSRRICLLLAIALPLLAKDDDVVAESMPFDVAAENTPFCGEEHHDLCRKEEDTATDSTLQSEPVSLMEEEKKKETFDSPPENTALRIQPTPEASVEPTEASESPFYAISQNLETDWTEYPFVAPFRLEIYEQCSREFEKQRSSRRKAKARMMMTDDSVSLNETCPKLEPESGDGTHLGHSENTAEHTDQPLGTSEMNSVETSQTTPSAEAVGESNELVPDEASAVDRAPDNSNTSMIVESEKDGELEEGNTVLEQEQGTNETLLQVNATEEVEDIKVRKNESEPLMEVVNASELQEDYEKQLKSMPERVVVDYASKSAGALILEKSAHFQGTSNLLNGDGDQYAIVPCAEEPKFVVLGLSEEILVKQVVLANYERYSSRFTEFKLLGSTTMGDWADLGTYTAPPNKNGKQVKQAFDLQEPSWARYLKFRFLRHSGNEHYCTVTQISVHGSTMQQGLRVDWSDDDEQDEDQADDAVLEVEEAERSLVGDPDHEQEGRNPDAEEIDAFDKTDMELDDAATDGPRSPLSQMETELCVTQLDAVCPRDWNFEKEMFLFGSTNYSSDFDRLSALSSASICVYSSAVAQGNRTNELRKLSTKAIASSSSQQLRSSSAEVIGDKSESVFGSLTESHLVKQIQSLLKNSKGIDVPIVSDLGSADASSQDQMQDKADVVTASGAQTEESLTDSGLDTLAQAPVEVTQESVVEVQQSAAFSKDDASSNMKVAKEEASKASAQSKKIKQDAPTPALSLKKNESDQKKQEHDLISIDTLASTSIALAKVLSRLPSAGCLGQMDFAKFKANAKLSKNGASAGANTSPGHSMEPILKKLADEIKTLQMSVAVHDRFAKESISCYQSVLLELMMEVEELRSSQESRIARLEEELLDRGDWFTALSSYVYSLVEQPFDWLSDSLHLGNWSSRRSI